MTQDDGMSWQALSGEYHYLRLASIGPATYALRGTGYESDVHLIVSTDGLRTWQVRDQALQARTGQTVNAFWLNPHTGALLARVGEYGNSGTLWTSADGGADWAPLPMAPPLPSTSEATNSLAVQPPMGDGPWHLCIAQQVGPSTASGSGARVCLTNQGSNQRTMEASTTIAR